MSEFKVDMEKPKNDVYIEDIILSKNNENILLNYVNGMSRKDMCGTILNDNILVVCGERKTGKYTIAKYISGQLNYGIETISCEMFVNYHGGDLFNSILNDFINYEIDYTNKQKPHRMLYFNNTYMLSLQQQHVLHTFIKQMIPNYIPIVISISDGIIYKTPFYYLPYIINLNIFNIDCKYNVQIFTKLLRGIKTSFEVEHLLDVFGKEGEYYKIQNTIMLAYKHNVLNNIDVLSLDDVSNMYTTLYSGVTN